jgi:hypothetical protein
MKREIYYRIFLMFLKADLERFHICNYFKIKENVISIEQEGISEGAREKSCTPCYANLLIY